MFVILPIYLGNGEILLQIKYIVHLKTRDRFVLILLKMENKSKDNKVKQRKLKVYSKHHRRNNSPDIIFPEIRLSGKYLIEYGFQQGETIIIICEENKITISKYLKE